MTGNEAVDLAAAVRGAAEAAQACLVEGVPEQLDRVSVPLVRLGQEDAARLLEGARPKAVYMIEVPFDPEEAINDAAESLAELGIEKLPASLKAAHRRVADRAGEICTTLAAFMVDGVMHTAVASADWHDAFDETLEAARAEAEAYGRADAKTASAEINAKAAILAAHPSFNFSRVSFEKRLTLAEALFADSGDLDLREVTRVAENIFWLEQSGFKPPPRGN